METWSRKMVWSGMHGSAALLCVFGRIHEFRVQQMRRKASSLKPLHLNEMSKRFCAVERNPCDLWSWCTGKIKNAVNVYIRNVYYTERHSVINPLGILSLTFNTLVPALPPSAAALKSPFLSVSAFMVASVP